MITLSAPLLPKDVEYFSTKDLTHSSPCTSLSETIFKASPSDDGLYMPYPLMELPNNFWDQLPELNFQEIAFQLSHHLWGKYFEDSELIEMVQRAFSFNIPLIRRGYQTFGLELFHGPTCAFKDVGARWMSQLMTRSIEKKIHKIDEGKPVTILVATSGDTGGAVASAFSANKYFNVIILYPRGKVSPIQEKQLTCLASNVQAIEVNADFDQCQSMVKKAFIDEDLSQKYQFTSANSINIGRLLPQSFYYLFAYGQYLCQTGQTHHNLNNPIYISVPCGNFGNLTAGLIAKKWGIKANKFLVANNANDTIVRYLQTGQYEPHETVKTYSNAMDIAKPNNWQRIEYLYQNDLELIRKDVKGRAYSDQQTINAIQEVYKNYHLVIDPHSALAYKVLEEELANNQTAHGIFLLSAHAGKFSDVIEKALKIAPTFPEQFKSLTSAPMKKIKLDGEYSHFKDFLLGND